MVTGVHEFWVPALHLMVRGVRGGRFGGRGGFARLQLGPSVCRHFLGRPKGLMQITGVQSVGARSLGSVSVTVADGTPAGAAAVVSSDREPAATAHRALHPEAVVFPRDGNQ